MYSVLENILEEYVCFVTAECSCSLKVRYISKSMVKVLFCAGLELSVGDDLELLIFLPPHAVSNHHI